jgi:hypothetical protein
VVEPERTEDGRYVVVDGRRWRATDPSVPEPLRRELVSELMAARRAVKAGEPDARERVQAAKVALGERGPRWWEDLGPDDHRIRLEAATTALARGRAPTATICPSDAARAVGGDEWRELMPMAREVARDLARTGAVEVAQRGDVLDPDAEWRGPIRVRAVLPA